MVIALDHDNTYSVDPALWTEFIKLAQLRGHLVIGFSGRDDDAIHRAALKKSYPPGLKIVLCDHRTKKVVARELGIHVDVWIDDYPEGIVENAAGAS